MYADPNHDNLNFEIRTTMTENVNNRPNNVVESQSSSTQTEWSWLEDLKTLGISHLPDVDEKPTKSRSGLDKVDAAEQEETRETRVEDLQFQKNKQVDVEALPVLKTERKVEADLSDSDADFSADSEDEYKSFFPSVGPPQMLEYLRESKEMLPEVLPADKATVDTENSFHKSFFSGPCQFCGQPILPLPTVEELENLPASQVITPSPLF